MRNQHNIRVTDKTRMDLGFFLKDVKTGRINLAAVKSLHKSFFVDDGTSSSVDNDNTIFHLGKFRCADDVASVFLELKLDMPPSNTFPLQTRIKRVNVLTFKGRFKLITSLVDNSSSKVTY